MAPWSEAGYLERRRRVLAWAENDPELHDQERWAFRNPCGSTYCFAGLTALLAGRRIDWDFEKDVEEVAHVVVASDDPDRLFDVCGADGRVRSVALLSDVAARELGLTKEQAGHLFWGTRTLGEIGEFLAAIEQLGVPA